MKINLTGIHPLSFVPSNKRISDVWNWDLIFSSNEKYLVIAPSGTGKSSLTGFLYGFRNDYSGEILFDDKNIKKLELDDWALIRQKKISIIFQDLRLFEQLSVEENIYLKCSLGTTLKNETINEFANRMDIADLFSRNVGTLSMGQKQRVAILRSLIQPFEFLLMDEPFSHLDPENISKALELINFVCENQKAGFIITSLE
ncbi:MAG: ATP-binding cassette domain-containing protein, partial [Bacteroidota bacterium]